MGGAIFIIKHVGTFIYYWDDVRCKWQGLRNNATTFYSDFQAANVIKHRKMDEKVVDILRNKKNKGNYIFIHPNKNNEK